MYRREQHWLEKQVHASNVVHDYDRRDRVPQPRHAAGDPGGPVGRFLGAFPDDEVLRLRTLNLTAMAVGHPPPGSFGGPDPVGRRRTGLADAAALSAPHMLGEDCANLVEFVQAQQAAGRLRVAVVDASGAAMDRVAFLVLKHFVRRAPALTTLRLRRAALTLTQFADLLDGLHDAARGLETLDVSGCGEDTLPLRSLAEFLGRSQTLRALACDGIHFPATEARHFVRGLLKNESLEALYLGGVGLGSLAEEAELLFRSVRHHKTLRCLSVADNGLSAAQLEPLLQALRLKKGFQRLDVSRNLPALREPALAEHVSALLRFNETLQEVVVDGLDEAGMGVQVANELRRKLTARYALLAGGDGDGAEGTGGASAPLLLEDGGGNTTHEALLSKQYQLEEDEALWRRHSARATLELHAAQAAAQNAEHDNQLLKDATAETQEAQEATVKECSELQAATALLQRRFNETAQKTEALKRQLQRQLGRNEELRAKFRHECATLDYAQRVREKLAADREHLAEKLKSQRVFLLGQQRLLLAVEQGNAAMATNVDAADAVVSAAIAKPDEQQQHAAATATGMSEAERAALSGYPLEYFEHLIASGGGGGNGGAGSQAGGGGRGGDGGERGDSEENGGGGGAGAGGDGAADGGRGPARGGAGRPVGPEGEGSSLEWELGSESSATQVTVL